MSDRFYRHVITVAAPLALAVVSMATACGGAAATSADTQTPGRTVCGAGNTTHKGDLRITHEGAAAVAAQCTRIEGDLVVEGGALTTVPPLAVTEVTGDVLVGPAFRLTSVSGLKGLTRVGGSLKIRSNLSLRGLFLNGLRRVEGDLVVDGNSELASVSLPRLADVSGNVTVARNRSLLRFELIATERVGGRFSVEDNPLLDDVVTVSLRTIDGGVVVRGNKKLAPGVAAALQAKARAAVPAANK